MEKVVRCPYCGKEFHVIWSAMECQCPECGQPIDLNNEDNPSKYDNPDNF